MKVAKDDVDVKLALPGAVLRQHCGFGSVAGYDQISGEQETVRRNDLFYWPPGHNVRVDEDASIVMFSPQHEHSHVIEHMIARTAG